MEKQLSDRFIEIRLEFVTKERMFITIFWKKYNKNPNNETKYTFSS